MAEGQEVRITETTVARINGVPVAASGTYKEGKVTKVNLTINRVVHAGVKAGDTLDINGESWELHAFDKATTGQKGTIVLRKR